MRFYIQIEKDSNGGIIEHWSVSKRGCGPIRKRIRARGGIVGDMVSFDMKPTHANIVAMLNKNLPK
jgi:hypothetical protein